MQRDIPVGTIQSWSGAIVDIPSTFRLCDGTNGTPDLRDKFIVGAGGAYAKGATGGSVNHNHPFTGDGHTHTLPGGAVIQGMGATKAIESALTAGTTDNGTNVPEYYALAYIMYTGKPS